MQLKLKPTLTNDEANANMSFKMDQLELEF